MFKSIKSFTRLVIFGVALMALWGCSESGPTDGSKNAGPVAINLSINNPEFISQVSQFQVTASGPDMETITVPMILIGRYLEGVVPVPEGNNRLFVVEAKDVDGRVLYTGQRVVESIEAGEVLELTVDMYPHPEVLLMKITPRYVEVPPLVPFDVQVKVFNIPDLYGITFRIHWEANLIRPDAAVIGTGLPGRTTFFAMVDTVARAYAISVTNTDQVNPLTDTQGNAHLATVSFIPASVIPSSSMLTIEITGMTRFVNNEPVEVDFSMVDTDACSVVAIPVIDF